MPEMFKRPKIRSIEVTIKDGSAERKAKGPDLNDVLRGIVIDLRNAWGLSTRALAFRLGVRQQTLAGFIDQDLDQGTRIEVLSRICAALDMTADEVFALHPQYATGGKSERAWGMVKNSLDDKTLELLMESVLIGSKLGVLPGLVSSMRQMVEGVAEAQEIDTASSAKEAKSLLG